MSSNGKINVLQIVEGMNWGGAETKLVELISHMDMDRFNTTVCSLGMGDRIKNRFEDLAVKFVNFERSSRIDPRLIFRVRNLIRDEKIDVVMTTLFYADVIGALASAISPNKAVFSWETISAPEWLLWHRLVSYRFAMRYCTKVVSVSHATAKWLVDKRGLSEEKVVVIPYGVNLREFKAGKDLALKQELGIDKDTTVIGTVARLHPQKGHTYLIEAAKQIIPKFGNVKFVFVGDGDLRADLEKEVAKTGFGNNFLFLGFRSDVKELLRVFDIFVLPSLYEGLPNVILEAMATALPVIATAVDGTVELVEDGKSGYLVEPKKPEQLIEKISSLLQDGSRLAAFGKRGRERVEKEYSLDLQVNNFQDLYAKYATNGAH